MKTGAQWFEKPLISDHGELIHTHTLTHSHTHTLTHSHTHARAAKGIIENSAQTKDNRYTTRGKKISPFFCFLTLIQLFLKELVNLITIHFIISICCWLVTSFDPSGDDGNYWVSGGSEGVNVTSFSSQRSLRSTRGMNSKPIELIFLIRLKLNELKLMNWNEMALKWRLISTANSKHSCSCSSFFFFILSFSPPFITLLLLLFRVGSFYRWQQEGPKNASSSILFSHNIQLT